MQGSQPHGHDGESSDDDLTFTRRTALALLGVGGFGAAASGGASAETTAAETSEKKGKKARPWNRDVDARDHDLLNLNSVDVDHVFTAARDADVIVWKDDDGVFHADGRDGQVASGEDPIAVIQAAIDSLSDDRTAKEKVAVVSPATVGQDAAFPIELPSYTTLDVPVPIEIEGEPDEEKAVVVRATDAESIEIPNLNVRGYPNFCLWLQSCHGVRLGDIDIEHAEDSLSNVAVRIDDFGETGRTTDVQVDQVYVKEGGHHAFETYSVDRIQVGQVIGDNPDGCVVLLNDTVDATIDSIVGKNPGMPGGYATFRVANAAHDITVGNIVSREGARGIFGVSSCYDVTVGQANIVGAHDQGILVQNCQNFAVEGGVVKNCHGEAVRIDSRDDGSHIPAEGVSISNLRVVDDSDDVEQTWAILESGPYTNNNRIVNNDVREGGKVAIYSPSTVVRDNVGGGIDAGTVTLTGGASPAARVEDVTGSVSGDAPGTVEDPPSFEPSALEARAKPANAGTDARYAFESYFEWTGDAWDLVFEWRTDPGQDLDVEYVVDKTK